MELRRLAEQFAPPTRREWGQLLLAEAVVAIDVGTDERIGSGWCDRSLPEMYESVAEPVEARGAHEWSGSVIGLYRATK